jgi:cytochrome c553
MKKPVYIAIMATIAVTISAVIYVYVKSHLIIKQKYDGPLVALPVSKESSSTEIGRKIALTRGCYGCHTENLAGKFYPDWDAGMVAANISKKIPQYSDEELYRLLKHGIKRDGTVLWSMPAGMFAHFSDKDISHLIVHLRTVPAVENKLPTTEFNFKARWRIATGQHKSEYALAREQVKLTNTPDNPTVVQQGQYLVSTTCTECHGEDLRGRWGSPPLIIAKTYKEAEFVKFAQDGKALGNRELPLMSQVSRGRLIHFSEDELKAIYAYLTQLQ